MGGSDFVKTYYEAVEKRFVGVVIGMKLITLKAELFCDSACRPDGVEVDFVNRNDIEQKKVAIVAYGCNKTRLVPLEQLKIIRESRGRQTRKQVNIRKMEERCRWAMLYTSDAKIIR